MQPTENAFDRVKSLLGKMDRSIDDARRRRLHEPEDDPDESGTQQNKTDADQRDQQSANDASSREDSSVHAPDRPASKYGRARPLNELPRQNGPDRQTA